MAGEVILVNARRRRGRRKKARSHRRKRARARRNPFYALSRRRRRRGRRRVGARRHRRAHRNPRLPLIGNVNLQAVGSGFLGYMGTRYGATWLGSMLPAELSADPNTAPLVRAGVKALVGLVALPMVAKMLRIRGVAGPLAVGAGIAIVSDLFDTYASRLLPLPAKVKSIADYEQQTISAYETQTLTGDDDYTLGRGAGAFGGGAF